MLSKCCCCIPRRTGSIILGIVGILGGLCTLFNSRGYWFYIMDAVVYLVAYGALLFGALKYNRIAVLINLVFTGIGIVLGVIFGIIAVSVVSTIMPELADNCVTIQDQLGNSGLTCDEFKTITIGTTACIFIVGSALNVYFWMCNYSFYQELKVGTETLA